MLRCTRARARVHTSTAHQQHARVRGPTWEGRAAILHCGALAATLRRLRPRRLRYMVADLQTEAGRDVIRQLTSNCDLLVDNFTPGKM